MTLPWEDPRPIVVLTALELERKAMRAQLTELVRHEPVHGTLFEVGHVPGIEARVVLGQTGEGSSAAGVLAGRAIEAFRPRALIFVGVAGALKGDVELGDVVVATKVYAVHGAKQDVSGSRARPTAFPTAHELVQTAQYLDVAGTWETDSDTTNTSEKGDPAATPDSRTPFRVHFKPIACGEVVLNSREAPLAIQLHDHYNDAVAIEMESAGAAFAAHVSQAVPMLAVRGISDKADGRKHLADADGGQYTAAAHAAAVAIAVIREWTAMAPPGTSESTADNTAAARRLGLGTTAPQVHSVQGVQFGDGNFQQNTFH